MKDSLSPEEMALWLRFRYTAEETSLRVSRQLLSATGLTGGQFGILNTLVQHGENGLRQQRLADLMRWDRTRLSHQLTRMTKKGLVKRVKQVPIGMIIHLTPLGRGEVERIRPILAEAVCEHFLERLTPEQRKAINALAVALRDNPGAEPPNP